MQVLLWVIVFSVTYGASLIVRGFVYLLAARRWGVDVQTLWFGYEKAVKSWSRDGTIIALGSWPTWVQIGVSPTEAKEKRWRLLSSSCLAWSVNAVITAILWPSGLWEQTISGRGFVFLQGSLTGAAFLANLLLCAAAFFLSSQYEVESTVSRDDRMRAADKADALSGHLQIAQALFAKGRRASASRWLQRTLRSPDIRSNLEYTAHVALFVLEYGDSTFALDLLREVLAKAERPFPLYWRDASDGLASQAIYRRLEGLLPEALSAINRAIDEFPESITLYGTRGGIHFDLGNYDEAARDLKHCNEKSSSALDRGISSAFLAAIAIRSGDADAARAHAKAARELAGDHVVVQRVLANMEPRDRSAPTRA